MPKDVWIDPDRGECPRQILVWRHAEAEVGAADLQRALTPTGHDQARKVAAWLSMHAPETMTALSSPAVRAQQTLRAYQPAFRVCEELAPNAGLAAMIQTLDEAWAAGASRIVLTGHQPTLGRFIAHALGMPSVSLVVRRASVWWLAAADRPLTTPGSALLRTLVDPDFVS